MPYWSVANSPPLGKSPKQLVLQLSLVISMPISLALAMTTSSSATRCGLPSGDPRKRGDVGGDQVKAYIGGPRREARDHRRARTKDRVLELIQVGGVSEEGGAVTAVEVVRVGDIRHHGGGTRGIVLDHV